MLFALNGLSTMHSNLLTDIRVTREAGYDGIEMTEYKLLRYLENGGSYAGLRAILEESCLTPVGICTAKSIEVQHTTERNRMLAEVELLSQAACAIGCSTVQLIPLCSLDGRSMDDILYLTTQNLIEIAKIGRTYGIRYQLEPIAFSDIHSLETCLKLIENTGASNIGLVIDFWHLWAGEETKPEEVAKLDKNIIYGVHFCDGIRKAVGVPWDEKALRSYLPGEGEVDIAAWVKAVKDTGYDEIWSAELYSPKHWEYDLLEIARDLRARMERYLFR